MTSDGTIPEATLPPDCLHVHRGQFGHGTAGVPVCSLVKIASPRRDSASPGGVSWCTESEGRRRGQFPWSRNYFCDQPNDLCSMGSRNHFVPQHLHIFWINVPVCESCLKQHHSLGRSVRPALGFSLAGWMKQIKLCHADYHRSWRTACLSCPPTRC